MKIAIPTEGDKLENEITAHFGRAKNFLIFNTKTNSFKIYQNPEAAGKAVLPPDFLKKLEIEAVICFNLGSQAFNLFKNYQIIIKRAIKRNIKENIEIFKKGKLKTLNKENIS